MSKVYVIRRIAYKYNDQYFSNAGLGSIEGKFTNSDEARKKRRQLEADVARTKFIGYLGAHVDADTRYTIPYKDVMDYCIRSGAPQLVKYNQERDFYDWIDRNATLPDEMTDQQVRAILGILGVKFHEINVYDETPQYYMVWLPRLNQPLSIKAYNIDGTYDESIYFYQTKDDALTDLGNHDYHFEQMTFGQSFADLSDTPELLQSFVENSEAWDTDGKKLYFNYMVAEDIIGINPLLKVPLFEIRPISFEDASKIPHDPFEAT